MKIGAILPLSASGSYGSDDLLRANMLFASLAKFSTTNTFEKILVVTPHDQRDSIEANLSYWKSLPIVVISERTLLPDLQKFPSMRGWRVQQLIKIAAALQFASQFYITLDADVLCVEQFSSEDLFCEGKSFIQKAPKDRHWRWWRASSYILGVPYSKKLDNSLGMAVTPAVLSTSISLGLMEALEKFDCGGWVENLCTLHSIRDIRNYSLTRYRMRKWTEYSLYYTYAESKGLLEKFHVPKNESELSSGISKRIVGKLNESVFDELFYKEKNSSFAVINSKDYPSPKLVLQKIEKHIGGAWLKDKRCYLSRGLE